MKKILVIISLLISSVSVGQALQEEKGTIQAVNNTPREKVFVHYNSSLLFTGEYLYYKIYTLNSDSGEFSGLSRVAYVEVVDQEENRVFRHKISLENGTGQGDFFIPPSVGSGTYKLLGYTSWNSNGGAENLFQADLVIINPYTNQQEGLLSSDEAQRDSTGDGKDTIAGEGSSSTVITNNNRTENRISESDSGNNILNLKTDSPIYEKREQVVLDIIQPTGKEISGNYSVSVRRIAPSEIPEQRTAGMAISQRNSEKDGFSDLEELSLPELRGELFRGRIFPKEEQEAISLEGRDVAFSIPGEDFILKISRTNAKGEFFFNVGTSNLEQSGIFQVLGEDREKFGIELEDHPQVEYEGLEFGNFEIQPEMKEWIVERSVRNQIENGYFEVKPDTLKLKAAGYPFYGDRMEVYLLDDYTRFKTVKETFIEIIKFLSIKTGSSGDEVLHVAGYSSSVETNLPPLLIVDGVLVQNHGDFIHYPAERIRSIGVIRDKYFLGPEVFQGVVTVETNEGNFNTARYQEFVHNIELLRPQPEKNYFKQSYTAGEEKTRIPDFRYQLLWQPSVDIDSQNEQIEFYTSDIPGDYEISLEGYTKNGEAVSVKKVISVQ